MKITLKKHGVILFFIIIISLSASILLLQKPIIEGVDEDPTADYSYDDKIKKPSDIGISKKGDWDSVEKNIVGLTSYIDVIISGDSKAAVGGGPLGDKLFVNTNIKCADEDGVEQDRYIYIDNVPNTGLIPGALAKFGEFNVNDITNIFDPGDDEKKICYPIQMQTRNNAHNVADETRHVTLSDIEGINACSFDGNQNPRTLETCKESFSNLHYSKMPDNKLIRLYYGMIGALGLYIVYCTLRKRC